MMNLYYVMATEDLKGLTLKYATITFDGELTYVEYNVMPGTEAYAEAIQFDAFTYTL